MIRLPHTLTVALGLLLGGLVALQQQALHAPQGVHVGVTLAILVLTAVGVRPSELGEQVVTAVEHPPTDAATAHGIQITAPPTLTSPIATINPAPNSPPTPGATA